MIEVTAGIDVGGTTTKFGLVTRDGKIISRKRINSDISLESDAFFTCLFNKIDELIKQNGNPISLKGLGIGAPTGNCFTGNIDNASNLPWKGRIPVVKLAEEYFKLPAVLSNDANAAALGEMLFGSARSMKNFAVLTIGTGLGCGLVINGELVIGHNAHAAEIGHSTVISDGRLCTCGLSGCLETYVSATGLLRTVNELIETTDIPSVLREFQDDDKLTAVHVSEAASSGDHLAMEAFTYTGKILGTKLADLVTYFDPEAIIFLGGLVKSNSLLLDPAKKEMEQNILNIYQNKARLIVSDLNNDHAGILGAAATAWRGLSHEK